MEELGSQKYELTDSRGVRWEATVSGPVKAGVMRPGANIEDFPERYVIRFRRLDTDGTIEVDAYTGEHSSEELLELLEQQPEWEYSDA